VGPPKHRYTAIIFRRRKPNFAATRISAIWVAPNSGRWWRSRSRIVGLISRSAETVQLFTPGAVFAHKDIDTSVLAEALVRIGEYVAENGIVGEGPYQAARDLLMHEAPRIGGEPAQLPGETTVAAALRIAPRLSGGVLPIQGPPAPRSSVSCGGK
jgi:hypothetical protein